MCLVKLIVDYEYKYAENRVSVLGLVTCINLMS